MYVHKIIIFYLSSCLAWVMFKSASMNKKNLEIMHRAFKNLIRLTIEKELRNMYPHSSYICSSPYITSFLFYIPILYTAEPYITSLFFDVHCTQLSRTLLVSFFIYIVHHWTVHYIFLCTLYTAEVLAIYS